MANEQQVQGRPNAPDHEHRKVGNRCGVCESAWPCESFLRHHERTVNQ